MNRFYSLLSVAALLMLCACGNENDFPAGGDDFGADVEKIDTIRINEAPLTNETEVVPGLDNEAYKNFVEYFLYDDEEKVWEDGVRTLNITFEDGKVSHESYSKKGKKKDLTAEEAVVTVDGAHITVKAHKKFKYVLTGSTSDGGLKVYGDKKCIVELNGVSITNASGAAINIQKGIEGGKRCFVVVCDGTKNYLTDGATYSTPEDEDEKGVVFSEDKLIFSGNGYLAINGKGKHGIASDDYVYLHKGTQITITPAVSYDGIKAKDGIIIGGGVYNISCSGDAAKGMNSDGHISIMGGRITVINKSAAAVQEGDDISYPYCVKTDSTMSVKDGTLLLSATQKGGIGIKAKQHLDIDGGTVNMYVRKAGMMSDDMAPAKGKVFINGKEQ